MINLDTVRAHVTAIGDLLNLPFAHPDAYEDLDDAALREHVAAHLRAALENGDVPAPPGTEKAPGAEGVLADYLAALRDLTDDEVKALDAAWDAARGGAWDAVLDTARIAAWDAADRAAVRDVAQVALRVAARSVAGSAAWGAAWYAALAVVVADLVGQHGLTREHLDTLTAPARTIPRLAKIIEWALPTESAR